MKRSNFAAFFAAALSLVLWTGFAAAEAKDKEAETITGESLCATCEGITSDGHAIAIKDKDGTIWVLVGEGDSYKKAHDVRKDGKTFTATLAGEPEVKKSGDKEYKQVKVSDIKIEA